MQMKEINPLYLQEETLAQLKESFEQSNPHLLHLPHFLTMSIYESLLKESENTQGTHAKIANKHLRTELPQLKASTFITSQEFLNWLSLIASKKINKITIKSYQYGHKDYVLLHDSETIGARLEFFILIMKHWDNRWGGHTVYVAQEQEPLLFPLEGNSFSIIAKEKNRHKFIQYVNHLAGKEKLTIIEGIAK